MEISVLSRSILQDLCKDSRITITELSKKYKISRNSVKERIMSLEKELGLKYTLELNYDSLGFATLHVLHARFSKKPKPSEVKDAFANSKVVQFAAITEGDFDMIIFALTKESKDYFKWEIALWTSLAKYGIYTASSELEIARLGFIPLNSNLISESSISDVYKKIIIQLNSNSRIPLRELSKKINLSEELTKYYVKKLNKENLIRRYTTIITKPPKSHNLLYFINYTVNEKIGEVVDRGRRTIYWKEPDAIPVLSQFQLMWATTGSESSLTWGCFADREEGLKDVIAEHMRLYKSQIPEIKKAWIKEVVKGDMPLRNLSVKENYDTTFGGPTDI